MAYNSPELKVLGIPLHSGNAAIADDLTQISLTDILGAIQSAYSEIGLPLATMVDAKVSLLELAASGDVERLVYRAIVDSHSRL